MYVAAVPDGMRFARYSRRRRTVLRALWSQNERTRINRNNNIESENKNKINRSYTISQASPLSSIRIVIIIITVLCAHVHYYTIIIVINQNYYVLRRKCDEEHRAQPAYLYL